MSDVSVLRQRLRLLGAIVAFVAALSVPVVYAVGAYIQETNSLSFKAQLNASRVSKYIYSHGTLWTYHRVRLAELIEIHPGNGALLQRIYSRAEKLVAQDGDELPTPTIMRSAPIAVGGEVVGRIDVLTTAWPLLVNTMLLAAGSTVVATFFFLILNKFRLNLLDKTIERLDLREGQLKLQNGHFSAALENMSHGLAMFDADRFLIVCNSRYSEIYEIPRELTRPGTSQRQILEHCITHGIYPGQDPQKYIADRIRAADDKKDFDTVLELRNGRVIAVSHRPLLSGGWVSTHQDVTEQHKARQHITYLAHHDVLTGLPNRVQLREYIESNLQDARCGGSFAVLCLDLDYFKNVNDTLGHTIGDALLCAVSKRLRDLSCDAGVVARTGGDEFSIVLTNADQPMSASSSLAERTVEAMSIPFDLGEHQVVIGTSVGIAIAPDDGHDADQLLKNADMALYRAKADGRGTFHFFEPDMDATAQARRLLELELRKAIATGEFEVCYQPIVNLAEDKIAGFEALVQWNHPSRGRMSPDKFIPLAEETGLVVQIGEWVLRQACAEAKTWPSNLQVAVNVSPLQFRNKSLVPAVMSALTASGLASNRLELEITEAVLLQNNDATLAVLHELRGLGVRISMDDFGTGYSSLSYLQSFPFDKIKIDQYFVRSLKDKPESIAIIRAVTSLGHSFGITTTAEGVETQEQLDLMRAEGCTEVQGYFFSKPMPTSEIPQLLSGFHKRGQAAA
jgi:diguanylate cyclase (GGDEF)-like protein